MNLFSKIQRHYHAFARFAHIWRHKHATIQINHDLYMTPLCKTSRNVFSLLQNGKIYLFTAANLANSISASLSNAPHFFIEPLVAKNPYNNVPFNKSSLYNIYFFIKQTPIIFPILFHQYFLADFDLRKFRDENENNIRNIAIKSIIHNAHANELYTHTVAMLKKYQPKIVIDKTYPRDTLAVIMRPYLSLYYMILYSTDEYAIINSKKELIYKLKRLYKYNPTFGRKIVKLKRNGFSKKMHKEIEYDKKCPNFDDPIDATVYHNTHIVIVEPTYTDIANVDTTISQQNEHTINDEDDDEEDIPFVIITAQPVFQFGEHLLTTVPPPHIPPTTENNTANHEEPEDNEHETDSDDSNDSDDNSENDENETIIEGDTDYDSENSDEDTENDDEYDP